VDASTLRIPTVFKCRKNQVLRLMVQGSIRKQSAKASTHGSATCDSEWYSVC